MTNIFNLILSRKYTEIYDIGCAEGYYAVGLALKSTSSRITAFDIDQGALNSCIKLAEFNNVKNRVEVKRFCSSDDINNFNFLDGLIISDCEGYELELFSNVDIEKKKLDYLIEIHEWPLNVNLAQKVYNIFEKTHHINIIRSTTDLHKAHFYPEIFGFVNAPIEDSYDLFKEGRGEEMQWYYCVKK